MTAEIVIMNKRGLAIAADSAVTASVDGGVKIFPSANKLFTLSKYQPVGIMIYNSSELLGIPWEVAVKTYRKELAEKSFSSLDEYAIDFLKFLESHDGLFPERVIENFAYSEIISLFESIRDTIFVEIRNTLNNQSHFELKNPKRLIDRIIDANYVKAKEMPLFQNDDGSDWSKESIREIEKKYIKLITKVRDKVFSVFDILNPEQKRKLTETGKLALSRAVGAAGYTGVVVAGYGANDYFPVLNSFEVYGNIGGRLRFLWNEQKKTRIDNDRDAIIVPFAQSEMVKMFMEGVDPSYQLTIDDALSTAIRTTAEVLVEGYSEEEKKEKIVTTIVTKVFDEISNTLKEERWRHFIRPVLTVLSALPKTELASMAESLVNLTSMKRHVSSTSETVGGPIDVALISKGDGFVWIKRKHYFDKDLNYHFFANYFKDGGLDENRKKAKNCFC